MRHLVLVFGDQLDPRSSAFDDFDPQADGAWMAEVEEEATYVKCHQLRLAAFFAAMRHHGRRLKRRGVPLDYHALSTRRSDDRGHDFSTLLRKSVHRHRPEKLIAVLPGDYRVLENLQDTAKRVGLELEIREDRHFYSSPEEFKSWAAGRRRLTLEDFYRHLRRRHGVLVEEDGTPEGEQWNYDRDNRASFGSEGPPRLKPPRSFRPDAVSREVLELVRRRFADHPGSLEHFDLPVTRRQARSLLRDFVRHRLATFGRYQDAMWTDHAFLSHSRLSFALNLHLLDPRECVQAAIAAYQDEQAPLNSVEGFVRQILGWREFVRGIYWREMPGYIQRNALRCEDQDVPRFFWDGQTQMACLRDCMRNVLQNGYAHHIQRLMVLGLFCQLAGVHPRRFHDWHMAMYCDAIDWVSLPNTLGMSQYGDGGLVATKPYCASGNYIHRMSNYCSHCTYRYDEATGDEACPFTTLYWDFLDRHRDEWTGNRRMTFQLKNLEKKDSDTLRAIRARAKQLRQRIQDGESL